MLRCCGGRRGTLSGPRPAPGTASRLASPPKTPAPGISSLGGVSKYNNGLAITVSIAPHLLISECEEAHDACECFQLLAEMRGTKHHRLPLLDAGSQQGNHMQDYRIANADKRSAKQQSKGELQLYLLGSSQSYSLLAL